MEMVGVVDLMCCRASWGQWREWGSKGWFDLVGFINKKGTGLGCWACGWIGLRDGVDQ